MGSLVLLSTTVFPDARLLKRPQLLVDTYFRNYLRYLGYGGDWDGCSCCRCKRLFNVSHLVPTASLVNCVPRVEAVEMPDHIALPTRTRVPRFILNVIVLRGVQCSPLRLHGGIRTFNK